MSAKLRYPNLWNGCVGAWCPSQSRSRSTILEDFSPSRNHGTLTNMDAATDWVVNGGDFALDFDGTNDFVAIATPTDLMSQLPLYSVSLWMQCTSATAGVVLSCGGGSVNGFNIHYGGTTSTKLSFHHRTSTGDAKGRVTTNAVNTGLFVHVVGVFVPDYSSTTSDVRIYVNGLSDAGTATGTSGTAVVPVATGFIGKRSSGNPFIGQLDDIRIYNRALSAPEISLLASRRGIAYETKRNRIGRATAVAGSNRNNMLVGCGF